MDLRGHWFVPLLALISCLGGAFLGYAAKPYQGEAEVRPAVTTCQEESIRLKIEAEALNRRSEQLDQKMMELNKLTNRLNKAIDSMEDKTCDSYESYE